MFENDRFAALSNIKVVDVSPGKATTQMEISDIHLNSIGTVHGGALFTQIMEHAIVHILRHRRQIERFLLKLRKQP